MVGGGAYGVGGGGGWSMRSIIVVGRSFIIRYVLYWRDEAKRCAVVDFFMPEENMSCWSTNMVWSELCSQALVDLPLPTLLNKLYAVGGILASPSPHFFATVLLLWHAFPHT
jgi:hypothetical protein